MMVRPGPQTTCFTHVFTLPFIIQYSRSHTGAGGLVLIGTLLLAIYTHVLSPQPVSRRTILPLTYAVLAP